MKTEIPELLDELRQICAQYAKEVPKKRRPWPESVRTRVMRLRFLGVSNHRIAQETGIPVMTLYCWRMPGQERARSLPAPKPGAADGDFLPVRVVHRPTGQMRLDDALLRRRRRSTLNAAATVTVKKRLPDPVLTVVLPNGLRLEGLCLEQAIKATRELSR